jgi:hypothetical protein
MESILVRNRRPLVFDERLDQVFADFDMDQPVHGEPFIHDFHTVPFAFGVAAVATPYIMGAALVAFGPPPAKAFGLGMLVPSPMDAVYFSAGYSFGQQVEDFF